jgi:hypothetical protein
MSDLITVTVTHTDTFCGEPNYGWVHRHEFEEWSGASRRTLVMQAKKACGLTGYSCDIEDYGDELTIRPRGLHQIVFVSCQTKEESPRED